MKTLLLITFLIATFAFAKASDKEHNIDFKDWLKDHANWEILDGKYEKAKREGAEELQDFADDLLKKRTSIHRKYLDLKWKTLEKGEPWDKEYENLSNEAIEKLKELEARVLAKKDMLLSNNNEAPFIHEPTTRRRNQRSNDIGLDILMF